MLVILTATGASVPVSGLIWAMTRSPSPSNTSLTRQLGLCSTGGNRLGDWSRGGCENISLNTFSRNTKTAILSDGIAFSLNSRQPWECGCKEFPLHRLLSALSRAYNGRVLLTSDHNFRTLRLIFRYLVSELPVHKCRVSHRAAHSGIKWKSIRTQQTETLFAPSSSSRPACGELGRDIKHNK